MLFRSVAIPKSITPQASLTDADYKELIELAFQQGTLAASEKEIILAIVQLDRRTAKDVMRPRARMAATWKVAPNIASHWVFPAA